MDAPVTATRVQLQCKTIGASTFISLQHILLRLEILRLAKSLRVFMMPVDSQLCVIITMKKCRRGLSIVHILLNTIPVVLGCIIIAEALQQLSYSIHMTPIWASAVFLVSGLLLVVLGVFGYCIQRRGFNPWLVSFFLLLFIILIALFAISAALYTYWFTLYDRLQSELLSDHGVPLSDRGLYYTIWAGYVGLWYRGGCRGALLCENTTLEGCNDLVGGRRLTVSEELLIWEQGNLTGSGSTNSSMVGVGGIRQAWLESENTQSSSEQLERTDSRVGVNVSSNTDNSTESIPKDDDEFHRIKLSQIYCMDGTIDDKMQSWAAEYRPVVHKAFDHCIEYIDHILEGEEVSESTTNAWCLSRCMVVEWMLSRATWSMASRWVVTAVLILGLVGNVVFLLRRRNKRLARAMRNLGIDELSDDVNVFGEISPTVTLTTCDFSPSGHRYSGAATVQSQIQTRPVISL